MLTVEQALAAVLKESQPLAPVSVELADALGLVSAEESIADIDSPPFDKALWTALPCGRPIWFREQDGCESWK